MGNEDIEDIIQGAYYRMAELVSIDHIQSPRGYFFTVAENIALMRPRRAGIMRIESVDEIDRLDIESDAPSPEQVTAARSQSGASVRMERPFCPGCQAVSHRH